MDIQAYISSGKLELFVLGELSEREQQEVITLSKLYPEIRKELDQIQDAMFVFDDKSGTNPPKKVKTRILETLGKTSMNPSSGFSKKPYTANVVSLVPWRAYAATATLLAIIASVFAVYFATRYYEVDQRMTAMLEEQFILAQEFDQYKINYLEKDEQLVKLLSGNFTRIPLEGEGFEIQKDAKVNIWWDKESENVYASVDKLSDLGPYFDYQLWAIGDAGPIGIGLVNSTNKFSLQPMTGVTNAGAFAITIEPKGGSENPTLEKLVVIGEVS